VQIQCTIAFDAQTEGKVPVTIMIESDAIDQVTFGDQSVDFCV